MNFLHFPSDMAPARPSARRSLLFILRLVAGLLLMLNMAAGMAQTNAPPPEDPEKVLDVARKQMELIRKSLHDQTDDAELQRRRTAALDIQSKADAITDRLTPILTSVQARLTELGPVPSGTREAPDVAAQRAQLEKQRGALDAQVKLAKLLSVEGGQTVEQVAIVRRAQFQASLSERRQSILGTPFWSEFRGDFPRDLVRFDALSAELKEAVSTTPGWAWFALLVVAGIVGGLWIAFSRLLMRLSATHVPAGRLRRSFHAMTVVLPAAIAPGLIGQLVYIGLTWEGQLADDTQALMSDLAGIVGFAGLAAGLFMALLEPARPSWRLLNIPDGVARGMRWFPLTLGPLIVLTRLLDKLPGSINASLSTTMAANCLVALLLGGIVAVGLVRMERLRRVAVRDEETGRSPPRPLWLVITVSVIWLVLCTALIALLVGYVAFGSFAAKQVIWALIVVAAAYLLSVLVDDFFTTVLGAQKRDAEAEQAGLHEPRLRDQAAVLLSGVARVLIVVIAVVMLLGQFGEGPVELLQRGEQLRNGVAIGEVQLRPAALMQGLLVLAFGLLGVRLLKRWLMARYLPTTTLDPGMQTSATTLFGYIGVFVAISLALSALGIGLERVAWVASALSVGIGFGLQAVVQNFVSGLILLAERPVKVGDWVSLGGVEGDIRRINVRATEIQMSDRSTVIVPNSEFITKTVRNVTHANPLGLVQIKLPMPLSTPAEQVRTVILQAFADHGDILDAPAPNVHLDGIEGGNLMFNATGYVGSPRHAYGTRSALLFEVLKRLAEAGLSLGKPPTMLVSAPAVAGLPLPLSVALAPPVAEAAAAADAKAAPDATAAADAPATAPAAAPAAADASTAADPSAVADADAGAADKGQDHGHGEGRDRG